MHKGLKSTLLTVAVALMGLKAMAMAPVIDKVPDVIIGDEASATSPNVFVYPDAINGDTLVSDDTTSDAGIHWTYFNSGGHYTINGRTSTNVSTDQVNPGATFDLTQGDDAGSVDANRRTFTFRNTFYTPANPPPAPGVQDGQVISLVASDGTTASTPKSFMAFIDDEGSDRLSGGELPVTVLNEDFTTSNYGWIKNTLFIDPAGFCTLTSGANGLCADVSAQGANIAGWASQSNFTGTAATAYHAVSLVDNAVYRLRTTLQTTSQAGATPLWYVMCENTLSWYGMSNDFYDSGNSVAGPGNNTPPGTGGGTRAFFESWFTPAAINAATFKTQAFNTPANAPYKDFRLQFQLLDVGTNPGNAATDPYGGASDQGMLCMKQLVVDRFNSSALTVQSTPYNNTTLTRVTGTDQNANGVTISDFTASGKSTVTSSAGLIDFEPTSTTAWDGQQSGGVNAFMAVYPGDQTNTHTGGADASDNYPVTWVADQLYRIVWTLAAPSALAETNGVDWIIIGGDVDTNEVIVGSFVTTKFSSAAMPKIAPQEYVAYWHGNGGTVSPGNFQRMRPYLFTGTNNDFVDTPNRAGIQVKGVRVEMVTP